MLGHVHDFKQILKSPTGRQSRESFVISMAHLIMGFGIQKIQMNAWLDTQMLIGPSALMIGKALPMVVSILEITWSHG